MWLMYAKSIRNTINSFLSFNFRCSMRDSAHSHSQTHARTPTPRRAPLPLRGDVISCSKHVTRAVCQCAVAWFVAQCQCTYRIGRIYFMLRREATTNLCFSNVRNIVRTHTAARTQSYDFLSCGATRSCSPVEIYFCHRRETDDGGSRMKS